MPLICMHTNSHTQVLKHTDIHTLCALSDIRPDMRDLEQEMACYS